MALDAFANKTLMITGGTGSFGNTVLRHFLEGDIGEIRILSRDEKKQDDMRHMLQAMHPEQAHKVRFLIGDVRDARSVRDAMRGVDYVFHAAALKQVPSCEFFPMEAVRTNVIGTDNVLHAAIDEGVDRVVCLSTDKAAYGQVQGHDGVHHLRKRAHRSGPHHDLLHALRQRHVLARQRHPPLHRPDPRRAPGHGDRPRHDALPDEPRRGGGPRRVRVPPREPRRPVHPEVPRLHDRRPRRGGAGALREDGHPRHRHPARREALRDPHDTGGAPARRGHGRVLPRALRLPRPQLRRQTQADEPYTSHNTRRLDVAGTVEKIRTAEYVRLALEGREGEAVQ